MSKPAAFDVVVVQSFSRCFRDHSELELSVSKLAKNGIRLVSITQVMGDDPMRDHCAVRRRPVQGNRQAGPARLEGKPAGRLLGWLAAEQRSAKVKEKLELDPLHADTVRLIYGLALEGDCDAGQMSVNAVVNHFNAKGIFTRNGGAGASARFTAS